MNTDMVLFDKACQTMLISGQAGIWMLKKDALVFSKICQITLISATLVSAQKCMDK